MLDHAAVEFSFASNVSAFSTLNTLPVSVPTNIVELFVVYGETFIAETLPSREPVRIIRSAFEF